MIQEVLGSSSLNFNTVNTLNVTSNAGMTVSSTAKLTLNTSATGTPTISLQQWVYRDGRDRIIDIFYR